MEVSENSIEAGDIVLFNMQSSSNAAFGFKHAVVYCGDGEVIHFQSKCRCPAFMPWQPTERQGDGQLFTFQVSDIQVLGY